MNRSIADNIRLGRSHALLADVRDAAVAANLVSELVRAAHQVDKLTFFEVGRLLDRAERTIVELRNEVGIIPIKSRDALLAIQTVAECAAMVSRDDWRATLPQAAEMIRDLHIVFETGMDINIVPQE